MIPLEFSLPQEIKNIVTEPGESQDESWVYIKEEQDSTVERIANSVYILLKPDYKSSDYCYKKFLNDFVNKFKEDEKYLLYFTNSIQSLESPEICLKGLYQVGVTKRIYENYTPPPHAIHIQKFAHPPPPNTHPATQTF